MRVREYEARELELEEQDLHFLTGFVRGTGDEDEARVVESLTPTRSGTWIVKSGPYVGRLGLPSGRWIDFISRFDFEDLLNLIRLSGQGPTVLLEATAEAGPDPLIVDLIAMAFARETERLAAQGLAKGYRPLLLTEPPYAGRPDIGYHLGRLGGRPDRLAMRAKRLTTDVFINRALSRALDVLLRVPLESGISRRLHRLRPVFRRVQPPPMTSGQVRRLRLTRLTERYRAALDLAALIVSSQEIAFQSGASLGGSVLFSMPHVWEGYVERWVRERWPNHRVEAQHHFQLTDDADLVSVADVLVFEGSRPAALYDAKYKFADRAPSRSDIYQMVTYCERLGLEEATLVYPVATAPSTTRVTGKAIHILGLVPTTAPAT